MTRFLLALAIAGACSLPAARALAGASCTDACNGPVGQTPCGSFGLGCPVGGGQCILCESNDHCQPGGTCLVETGQCVGLPCSPMDGGPGDSGEVDSGGGDGGANDSGGVDTGLLDTGLPFDAGDAGDAGHIDGGRANDASIGRDVPTSTVPTTVGPGGTDHGGCGCSTAGGETAVAAFAFLAFALLILRKR